MAPAVFVFGDSLVDVGNNNYLGLSIEKAILPHYGIDFPTKKPNGRFSNGKNAADLIGKRFKIDSIGSANFHTISYLMLVAMNMIIKLWKFQRNRLVLYNLLLL